MRSFIRPLLGLLLGLATPMVAIGQVAQSYDLNRLLQEKKLVMHNRQALSLADASYKGIVLNEREYDGVAWLKDVNFLDGVIEVDFRGKDVIQQSFLGIAFHGTDSATYEAIYFRPFNFQATDTTRRNHAVQYVSHPVHTWKKLREEHYSVYENPVEPAPNPNGWFHARIEIKGNKVRIFVDQATVPSLEVTRLSDKKEGKIGLWVGNHSGGDFANLSIKAK